VRSNHWLLAGIALLAAFVFLSWLAVRLFRRFEKKAPMKTRNFDLGYHLVAFLDVQGQRERFRELQLPKNPEETAAVAEVLRQTAGFVLELRQAFDEQFERFEAGATSMMKRHTQQPVRPKFVGFSDSFIASVPLRNDSGDLLPIVRVFSALSAAAVVMLICLASKHPLRGGIDVGLATEIGPQEIYGAALESAYLLESEEAGYPRIVVGDELWRYFSGELAKFRGQTTAVAQALAAITQRMMGLIATDTDGKRILDYLGQTMVQHAGPGGGQKDVLVRRAYDFVLAEQKRIVGAKNSKLIPRYEAFRGYVESRLPLWGLEAKKD
jgi:membrane protein implicated in regulation of membrane protease activity